MQKIIVLYTDGDSREDGNVFYSQFFLVESDSLKFDEPILKEADPFAKRQALSTDDTIAAIRALGYTVTEPDTVNIEVDDDAGDEDEED